jgi:biopolymer transport protein ExbB
MHLVMRYRNSFWTLLLASCMVVTMAGLALAQDGAEPAPAAQQGGGGAAVSLFQQFFLPGDLVGIAITWLLLTLSVVVIALVIHFLLQNRTTVVMPETAVAEVEALLDDRRFKEAIDQTSEDDSVFGQIIHASLSEASAGYAAMERAIDETGDLVLTRRFRPLEYLNVIGAIGPMLGLFGTVYGMIVAFDQIRKIGNVQPDDLAGGIGTALVTTFWGLVVGIPAVAGYALIRNRIDALVTESMIEAQDLIARFRPGAARKGGGSSSGSSSASGGSSAGQAAPKPKPEG